MGDAGLIRHSARGGGTNTKEERAEKEKEQKRELEAGGWATAWRVVDWA